MTHQLKVVVYTMAQNREVSAFKIRGQWRFRRNDIDRWIDDHRDKKTTLGEPDA
jgi:excisionase family DNA binding protein